MEGGLKPWLRHRPPWPPASARWDERHEAAGQGAHPAGWGTWQSEGASLAVGAEVLCAGITAMPPTRYMAAPRTRPTAKRRRRLIGVTPHPPTH